MLKVALTGGVGSGKSTLAALMAGHGAGLVDLDAIGRELTAPGAAGAQALRARFGDALFEPGGALDRAQVRQRAFADAAFRRELEQVLHPLIWQQARQAGDALAARCDYLLFDVPLLSGAGAVRAFDRVLVIDCPVPLQSRRVLQRSGLQRAQVDAILAAQATREQRLELADDIVFNGEDLDALARCARRLHERYRQAAAGSEAV